MINNVKSHKVIHFITPNSQPNLELMLRTLSYREINSLEPYMLNGEVLKLYYYALKFSVVKIEDKKGVELPFSFLSSDTIKEVGKFIFEVSDVTLEVLNKLYDSIDIYFDSKFKAETWKCEVCKAKRLDRVRNCGFRGEKNKKKDFKVYVGDKVYTYCPIYDVDKKLIAEAIECYNAFEKGFLPDEGGLYDQTKFFYLASLKLYDKIQQEEMKELQKNNKESSF